MSKIKNGGLDQYGAEPFEQQQFISAGVEWMNEWMSEFISLTKKHSQAGTPRHDNCVHFPVS